MPKGRRPRFRNAIGRGRNSEPLLLGFKLRPIDTVDFDRGHRFSVGWRSLTSNTRGRKRCGMSRLARIVPLAARLSTVMLSGPKYVGARRISICFPRSTYIAEQAETLQRIFGQRQHPLIRFRSRADFRASDRPAARPGRGGSAGMSHAAFHLGEIHVQPDRLPGPERGGNQQRNCRRVPGRIETTKPRPAGTPSHLPAPSPDQDIRCTSECNVFRTPGDGNGSERLRVVVDGICRGVLYTAAMRHPPHVTVPHGAAGRRRGAAKPRVCRRAVGS